MTALPLAGKRILITRASGQGSKLQGLLEAAGADVLAIPAIEIVPPDSYAALDAALRDIVCYDWLVLTSANAVQAIASRAAIIGVPLETLTSVYIAAIGNATADAVSALGLPVELIPPKAVAESLADALTPLVMDKRVLLVRAAVARDVLPERLQAAGANVTIADAYRTIVPRASVEALAKAFAPGATSIHAITFTSASSVHNFIALAEAARAKVSPGTKSISIGPITTRALVECGFRVDAEALDASIKSLVDAVIRFSKTA